MLLLTDLKHKLFSRWGFRQGLIRRDSSAKYPKDSIKKSESKVSFVDGAGDFITDPNKIISAAYWISRVEDASFQLRVPHMGTLNLRTVNQTRWDDLELFPESPKIAIGLQKVVRCLLINCVMARRGISQSTNIFVGAAENFKDAGLLLLRETALILFEFGRIKKKSLFLFEKCLLFTRQKSLQQIIVLQVPLADLLQVRYRQESPERGVGVLTVYWRDGQSPKEQDFPEQEVYGAEIFFHDPSVLRIWASFLAINVYPDAAMKSVDSGSRILPEMIRDDLLSDIPETRDVVHLLPGDAIWAIGCTLYGVAQH